VGLEAARHQVQVNAIAQNFVENPTYYPPEMLADSAQVQRLLKMIPARRIAKGVETAELALFLASAHSDFIVGQIIPFAGGWVTTV
jgi:2-keto-3-deoxy-L-fuconate dehydrogenase